MTGPAAGGHYERIASAYADRYLTDNSDVPLIERFVASLPNEAKVLDAGCGPGMHTAFMHGLGLDVLGIDVSPAMLQIATEAFPECTFVPGDIRALAMPDAEFDGVLCAYSLVHIPSAMFIETLRELARVLKPGGVLCVIAQAGEPDHVEVEPLDPSLQLTVNFFQEESLRRYALAAGFHVAECESVVSLSEATMADKIVFALLRTSND